MRIRAGVVIAGIPAVFLTAFFAVPVVAVVTTGFGGGPGSGSPGAVLDVLGSTRTWRLLGFTAFQAVLSAIVTLVVGLPLAYVLARYRFPGAGLLRSLVIVPFVLPTVVVGAAFLALIGPTGVLGVDLTGTVWSLVAAHVFLNIAVVVRTVGSMLGQLDPRAEDAARMLGASRATAFRTITWPLIKPAVVASGVVVGLFCFTSFGVVQVLGAGQVRTLEVEIYRTTAFDLDLAAAAVLSLLQMACVLTLLVVVDRLQRRRDVRQRIVDPGDVARRPRGASESFIVAAIAVGGAIVVVAPVAIMVLRAFIGPEGWTLAYWTALFTDTGSTAFIDPWVAIRASLTTAVVAAALALIVGGCAALAVSGRETGDRLRHVDALLMLPLGTSAVTIGLGLFLALDQPPLDLRDSWWLIPIAQALVAMPFVVRVLLPALRGFDRRFLDAAAVLGATPSRARRTIEWPALRTPAIVATGFAFAVSIGEFGATVFLARADTPTLPIAVARLLGRPGDLSSGQAYAASVLLLLLTGAVVIALDRLRTTSLGEF